MRLAGFGPDLQPRQEALDAGGVGADVAQADPGGGADVHDRASVHPGPDADGDVVLEAEPEGLRRRLDDAYKQPRLFEDQKPQPVPQELGL